MEDRFQNKYRITSTRLKNWDYRSNGVYYITICTRDREPFFGEITHGKMQFSNTGIIANLLWQEIVNHTKNVELGEFIVMPNHIHGILILNGFFDGDGDDDGDVDGDVEALHATPLHPNETHPNEKHIYPIEKHPNATHLHPNAPPQQNPIPPKGNIIMQSNELYNSERMSSISPKPNSISTIIRSYKSEVTKHANRFGLDFGWQKRFYDIIIRDGKSYQRISNYIKDNPKNWGKDKLNKPE